MMRAALTLLVLLPFAAGAAKYRNPLAEEQCNKLPGGCYITAYYDTNRVRGLFRDWNCGAHTYDNHDGIDMGIGGFPGMDQGRNVVAAAKGTVIRVHDGEFDRCTSAACGESNYVWIKHADGLITLYYHLKKNSIVVNVGDTVTCGQKIAQVGSSGYSSGPHLHFQVNYSESDIYSSDDPFAASNPACGGTVSLWVSQSGYVDHIPDYQCEGEPVVVPKPEPKPEPTTCSVTGDIKAKYDRLGGAGGVLGKCTTSQRTAPDGVGRYNHFENGSIYWHPKVGAFAVLNGIKKKWSELGWEQGRLGYPTTDELVTADRQGRYNHFQKGSIYWHPSTGAFAVVGGIHSKWRALASETGPLGYPTTDERPTVSGGSYNHFQKGSIYWHPKTGAFSVLGVIKEKWAALGWEGGTLGYPITDQKTAQDGGAYNHFQKGSIYWHPKFGAVYVGSGIHEKWATLGYEAGVLGYPKADEGPAKDTVGRYVHFQNGSIYWHPKVGAFAVRGEILTAWAARDWERGPLGYPVADEVQLPDGKGRYGEFQHGAIVTAPDLPTSVLAGDVFVRWRKIGATSSCLGYPLGDSFTENGAIVSRFQGGTIIIDGARLATDSCSSVAPSEPEPEDESGFPKNPAADPLPGMDGPAGDGADLEVKGGCSQSGAAPLWTFALLLLLLPALGVRRRVARMAVRSR